MKLAVFGASGRTGRQVAAQALTAGHAVRALVRSPARAAPLSPAVQLVIGDATDPRAVGETIDGADAVLSCLGSKATAGVTRGGPVVAAATEHIAAAARSRGVRRLIALSTYGAGDSWPRLRLDARLVMALLLRGELADKNAMEAVLGTSGLDVTVVRPVNLSDGAPTGRWVVDPPRGRRLSLGDWIPRGDVAAFMLSALLDPHAVGRTVILASPTGGRWEP